MAYGLWIIVSLLITK